MFPVKIEWLSKGEGGRSSIPPLGKYYSVSHFPKDLSYQSNRWSVVFEITEEKIVDKRGVSFGLVNFLVEGAPQELLKKNKHFEIYEGSKKVANVFLLKEKESVESLIEFFQNWYLLKCDGKWEHEYGFDISTIDNPSWKVHISGENKRSSTSVNIDNERGNWITINANHSEFKGYSSPQNLSLILKYAYEWLNK